MKLPERVRIAVDVLHHLKTATGGQPQKVRDLAVIVDTSENFLHQVVAKLGAAKKISVIKGPKGGVAPALSDVNLLQVYQVFGYMNEEIAGSMPSSDIERKLRSVLENIVL
jgi:DNA-binding IscR family transcriptional regulator